MDHFLHMGGYARFVWPCYGLTVVVLGWNIWSAVRLERGARRSALQRLASAPAEGAGPDGR